MQQILEFD